MEDFKETKMWRTSGFAALLVVLAAMAVAVYWFVLTIPQVSVYGPNGEFWTAIVLFCLACVAMGGFFIVQPNEAKIFTFFGRYVGSVREAGFGWTNPLTKKQNLSLRVRNFATDTLKVNDFLGNPIEIGAIVVWRVVDTSKALFSVQNYADFVTVQSETALRVQLQERLAPRAWRSTTRGSRISPTRRRSRRRCSGVSRQELSSQHAGSSSTARSAW